jgi:acyl dehydratase
MGAPPIDQAATVGMIGGVHGEHDLIIRKPLVPGSWVHTTGERSAVVCSKAGMNTFMKLVTVDDEGDTVFEQYWSSLMRGEVTGGDHGTPPSDHNFPDDARERKVGSMSLHTTRDQTFRYAGASADRAPMHVDDEMAKQVGFPRKFNQGLCTLAVTSRGLIELAAGGDPRRVRRIAVRFSSPVFPGNSIDLSVYDIGPTGDGAHAYAFEAESEGAAVLRHGRFEVLDN